MKSLQILLIAIAALSTSCAQDSSNNEQGVPVGNPVAPVNPCPAGTLPGPNGCQTAAPSTTPIRFVGNLNVVNPSEFSKFLFQSNVATTGSSFCRNNGWTSGIYFGSANCNHYTQNLSISIQPTPTTTTVTGSVSSNFQVDIHQGNINTLGAIGPQNRLISIPSNYSNTNMNSGFDLTSTLHYRNVRIQVQRGSLNDSTLQINMCLGLNPLCNTSNTIATGSLVRSP